MLATHDVIWIPIEADVVAFRPSAKFLQTGSCLVRQLADDCCIEEWLYLDGTGKIKLLGLRLRCFVPFLQDLRECCSINFDELLEFVEIIAKLLKAFF